MKILITGGSGFLGQYLNLYLSDKNEVLTIYNKNEGNCKNFNFRQGDIQDKSFLTSVFESFSPETVIHTAAVTQPNTPLPAKTVYNINVNAAGWLAELCSKRGSRLIYTSTDLVYAGYRGSMLKEDAKLIPVSLYAETKLMGEEKIKEAAGNYLILRTALLFGFGLNYAAGFFLHMYNNLKDGKEVKLFTDQYRTPLSVLEAARIIKILLNSNANNDIINLGGPERVSRFELGEILCESTGFNKELLIPITMDDIPGYPKVEDVSMNSDKLQHLEIKQKSLKDAVEEVLKM